MTSAFANRSKKTITLGGGDDEFQVVLRKLSGSALETAAKLRQKAVAENTRAMGGEMMETFARIAEAKKASDAAAGIKEAEPTLEQKRLARYQNYDRQCVLTHGIDSWTAKAEDGSALDSDAKNIAQLDEESSEKAFRELLDMSLPELDKAAAEAVQAKN
jgi:hypothetical protein